MPIVASRMLALLGAAQDYRAAAKRMHQIIQAELAGPASAQERLDNIALLAVPALLMRDPEGSAATLAAEATHWRPRQLAAAKRQAEWQRAKRGQPAGVARMAGALPGYQRVEAPLAPPDKALSWQELEGEPAPEGGHLNLETLDDLDKEVERALAGAAKRRTR